MTRQKYRYTSPEKCVCTECNRRIQRGMPVVYVSGPNRPIHKACESLYELKENAK